MTFKPGERISISGIYTVIHDPSHEYHKHDVTGVRGRRFPPCKTCDNGVRFKLKTEAVHVHDYRTFPDE
jgi:hypothetical protein